MDPFGRKPPGPGTVPDPVPAKPACSPEGHPSDDVLEEYAFGRLAERDIAPLEEHFMLCEDCRDSLERVEGFIQSLKSGILVYRHAHPNSTAVRPVAARWWAPGAKLAASNLAWGAALAAAILVAILLWPSPAAQQPAPTAIALASFRGSNDRNMARGPAGRPLELALDAAGIGNGVRCRVEVVTLSGETAWDGASNPEDGKLLAHVPKGLRSGSYWVRLYAPGDELIREFSLRLD